MAKYFSQNWEAGLVTFTDAVQLGALELTSPSEIHSLSMVSDSFMTSYQNVI